MRRVGSQAFTRLTLAGAIGLGLAACEPRTNPSGTVDLTNATEINAREQRAAQLATGTYKDDIPELTGAPDAKGRWPAHAANNQTVYRDDANLEVGSEGPYADVSGR